MEQNINDREVVGDICALFRAPLRRRNSINCNFVKVSSPNINHQVPEIVRWPVGGEVTVGIRNFGSCSNITHKNKGSTCITLCTI
jgi:hypothetical protein